MIERHSFRDESRVPHCCCGWTGWFSRFETIRRAQYTGHVRDVGALTQAGLQVDMTEPEAERAADHLARHAP